MDQGMIKIDDWEASREIDSTQHRQAGGPVNQEDNLASGATAATAGFQAYDRTKVFQSFKARNIRGGVMIADGVAFFITLVLREHTTQLAQPRCGTAIRLLALATG